jgi:hypothetical protein
VSISYNNEVVLISDDIGLHHYCIHETWAACSSPARQSGTETIRTRQVHISGGECPHGYRGAAKSLSLVVSVAVLMEDEVLVSWKWKS